jgi:predicted nucleic acid-binding protein
VIVFIDAGGWLSVLIESDQFHEAGKGYFQALMAIGGLAMTTDFVLDEVVTRLRYDVGHAKAAEFLTLIHEGTGATTSRTAKCHHIPNTLGVGLLEKRPPERDAT